MRATQQWNPQYSCRAVGTGALAWALPASLHDSPLLYACVPLVPSLPAQPHLQVGCGTTELGDRPWLPGAPSGYFSARIR